MTQRHDTQVLDGLLFNLDIIGGIAKGQKINTSDEFIDIERDSIFQGVVRSWNGESRKKAMMTVCNLVNNVIVYSELILESKYLLSEAKSPKRAERVQQLKKISNSLSLSRNGVKNLCETYSNDSNVMAKLKPLLLSIEDAVTTINKWLLDQDEVDPSTLRF